MGNKYSMSSMLAIEKNGENYPILNVIYDILAELHNQRKQITLCKEIEGNKEAGKAAKEEIDMPGMITTKLPHTYYYLTIRRGRNSKCQRE